ncbi:dolichyl-phosphate-mannose-protein mannosyltransferase [Neorhizobium alkalisoli]|uniref:Dolichyl-phosphate-mannose-protein mannosyltransferase n=2 Tax=Neorhizobium alkalisoli TaxID=528178 RepID=A0A561QRX6_9HYPH|nr:dolichyl-phosphate-mannose-protein mannosyltransferase [Neorhizobium alkalisoli]
MDMVSDKIGSEKSARIAGFADRLSAGFWPAVVFLGLYFVISIAIRVALPNGLSLDEAEQSLFSQYWLLGYGPQPPFFNWVQNAAVGLMGISLFSLALPKFLILFLAYVFYGMAGWELRRSPVLVAFAMLALVTLPQVSVMPQLDLTHTVAVLMAASLFLYGLCRVLQRADWQGYAILGLAIGIGTISKYNFVLLPASAVLAVFCDRQWRPKLFHPLVLLSFAVSIAIVLPHALWLLDNLDLATRGTMTKMVEANAPHGVVRIIKAFGSLIAACLAFGALCVVALSIAFRRDVRSAASASDRWTRLFGLMMLFSLAGVVLVILVAGTTKITERWLDPYLLVLPLYLLLKLEKAGADLQGGFRRLLPFLIVVMVVSLLPSPVRTLGAAFGGPVYRTNMPFADLGEVIRKEDHPAAILARGMHLAGNMRLQFPGVPVINTDSPDKGIAIADIRPPVLVIEVPSDKDAADKAVDLRGTPSELGLTASESRTVVLPYRFGGDRKMSFRYLWLR